MYVNSSDWMNGWMVGWLVQQGVGVPTDGTKESEWGVVGNISEKTAYSKYFHSPLLSVLLLL